MFYSRRLQIENGCDLQQYLYDIFVNLDIRELYQIVSRIDELDTWS